MSDQPSEGRLNLSTEARQGLSRYVWKVAIPRECAIVVLVNAPWAWLVFRGREDITHLGWGGLMAFLGPMSFVLPFFTSFFRLDDWNHFETVFRICQSAPFVPELGPACLSGWNFEWNPGCSYDCFMPLGYG